ncbi:MAG TPA: lysophospholipid acyltransferase family protein [Solimonas sp.]
MIRRLPSALYAWFAAATLSVAFFFVCLAVIITPTLRWRREVGRAGVRLALACVGVRIRVRGLEHLPTGANIVVANHASYLDGLVLTAALPRRYSFVVQDGAAGWPLVGLTIRRMNVIFVNRAEARAGARITRLLMRRLQAQESLTIFAEGTFKPEPGLLPFKNGAFIMAARTGAAVVPAGIRGTRRLYGGGRRLPRWSTVEIEIGQPLQADGPEREDALRLRDAARTRVLALCGEPDTAK